MGSNRVERIWPRWAQTVADMEEAGATVRFHCRRCSVMLDVDVPSLRVVKGRSFSLIDRRARCKVTGCMGMGFFLATASASTPPIKLLSASRDMDPEPDPPPPKPPNGKLKVPLGVDRKAWEDAKDDRERRLLIRRARD